MAMALCLLMTGLPFGTAFPEKPLAVVFHYWQSPASWQGPPAVQQAPIFQDPLPMAAG